MKPKALITLGCSFTEGHGCYIEPLPYYINISDKERYDMEQKIQGILEKDYEKNLENFRKHSWSYLLGKNLGFDKVINLGLCGSSNDAHLKILFDYLENNSLDNNDVLIIWYMTEPSRFSFYVDGKVKSYIPTAKETNGIEKEYLKEISNIDTDPILEQRFYIKVMESFCKLNNFDLILTSMNPSFKLLHKIYQTDLYLEPYPTHLSPPTTSIDSETLEYYSFCSHPNQKGYEWIADKMGKDIKKYHSKWYSDIPNENVEYTWQGEREIIDNKASFLI